MMKTKDMMDFYKNSAVFGTQAVLKSHILQNMDFNNSIWLKIMKWNKIAFLQILAVFATC